MPVNMVEAFQEYWKLKGRFQALNPQRTLNNSLKMLSSCQTINDIDECVCNLKSSRESTRLLMLDFYSFLEKKYGMENESVLQNIEFYDYPFQRQLEIAKYLHEPHTRQDIEEHFFIDDRTVRKDLNELEKGIKVLGATIQICAKRKNRKYYYKTTMHPVFLPLNLTEVYALTVYLDRTLTDNDPNANIIRSISDRIKGQLSDYALQRLYPGKHIRTGNRYIDDEKLAESREGILMYLMKSGQPCSFYLNGVKYRGSIIPCNGSIPYKIRLDDGTVLDANPAEAEFILDELDYR